MNFERIREKVEMQVDIRCFKVCVLDGKLIYKGAADVFDNSGEVETSLFKSSDKDYIVQVSIGIESVKYYHKNEDSAVEDLMTQLKLFNGEIPLLSKGIIV